MKHLLQLLQTAVLFVCFCQCVNHPDSDGYGLEYPLDPESYDAIDSCMNYMDTDPARAHRMLDSVCSAGTISPQRCDYLHAMVVFEGEHLLDSALMICNRLLDKGEFGNDNFLEAEICELATNICFGNNRYIEVLQYATRGIALCHGNERLSSDEAEMMGRAGAAHQKLGHYDEARQTYERAFDLLREDTSFGGLIALISLQKKQASLYREVGDYDKVIAVCHEILDQVERFDRDPSFVNPRPKTMEEPGEATHGFADFYQTQIYINLARAYRMKVEEGGSMNPKADRDSATAYVEKWIHTAGSRSPLNMLKALHELYFTGHRTEFDAAKQLAVETFGSDTLVLDYAEYLKLMAQEAASRNDLGASNSYMQRAMAVSDSIRAHELLSTFSEKMSIYMVKEAQLAQADTEYELSRNKLLSICLGIILVTCIGINVLFLINLRRRKDLEKMQQDMVEIKEEVLELEQQLEDAKNERAHESMATLYQHIEQAVTEKKLYLNPDFDIRMLSEEVCSSRTNISVCINRITGKTFRSWLSEYRLKLFVQMLEQYPDESIDTLMTRCGYREQSTFRRQFKAAYGMNAGDYRKQLLLDK